MRLNDNFLCHITGGEAILVPTASAGFSGVVRGNATFGAILGLLGSEITEDEIVSALRERFDAADGAIERDVKKALSELRRIGAVDE